MNNSQIYSEPYKSTMKKQFQHIHTKQIDEISGGDNAFKLELVDIILEQIPEFAQNIKAFHEEKDWHRLAREAHTAKSSALTFGMEKAGNLLKDIQLNAENAKAETLVELVKEVLIEFKAALPELEELKLQL